MTWAADENMLIVNWALIAIIMPSMFTVVSWLPVPLV